jgi:hypothetical protein
LPQPSPTFRSITPRYVVPDLGQAFAFYERLGFRTADYGSIAIIDRDGVEIQFNMNSILLANSKARHTGRSRLLPVGKAMEKPDELTT